jgi:hypothetical protein
MGFALGFALTATPCVAQEFRTDASYPAPGHVYALKFGDREFHLNFDQDRKHMTYTRPDGSGDTLEYVAVEIRPQIFLVYWTEPKSGSRVTHVEDFERGVVWGNTARTDGSFIHSKGTLKLVN